MAFIRLALIQEKGDIIATSRRKVLSHKHKVHQTAVICSTQFLMTQNWLFHVPECSLSLLRCLEVTRGDQHPSKTRVVPQYEQHAFIDDSRNVSTWCRISVRKVEMGHHHPGL